MAAPNLKLGAKEVSNDLLRSAHIAALARMFRRLDELLADYRVFADNASYYYANKEVAQLRDEVADTYLDLGALLELREQVERYKVALAQAVEMWREGFY